MIYEILKTWFFE